MAEKLFQHERAVRQKLEEAKGKVEVFGMDYDGTLVDGEKYQQDDAIILIEEILAKGKIPAFMTARAATAVKTFVPPLRKFYKDHRSATETYIGGGNGTVLYKVGGTGIEKIYNHGLALQEIQVIVSAWEGFVKEHLKTEELSEKGLTIFSKFYDDNWQGLIPEEALNVGRPYHGQVFTEEAKVTFVLPKDISCHQKVVDNMQKLVGDNFSVAAGDKDFCHITKRLREDSKTVAIKTVLERLGLGENQVATFGDMPHGNDKGLLSFPFSFTNYSEISSQKDPAKPPFILPEEGFPPVARVYKAIRFLLS